MEILPFEDPIVVIELDGASLWQALESSLSTWPAQEGYVPEYLVLPLATYLYYVTPVGSR